MAKRISHALALLCLPLAMMGCGKDCQSTCTKLYGTAPDCGDPEGDYFDGLLGSKSRNEKMSTCMKACNDGLKVPGEVGEYDPYTQFRLKKGVDRPELENDRQVALWMECVAEHSCTKLSQNYCEPVW
jgi:predicted small secreted protein